MSWKEILKNDMKRVRDKDRRRNPEERDMVDIEPKPKEELPPPSKKPFNPFGSDAGKRARDSKKRRAEREKREAFDSMMDTKPSSRESDLLERARKLKEQRAKEGEKLSDEDDELLTREQRIARIKALKRGHVKSPRMGVEGGTKGRGSKRYGKGSEGFRGQ
tara:strand:+ start:2127 stop:2612 length:486 start_codon:yes stop_codon:yes gene_type:complete